VKHLRTNFIRVVVGFSILGLVALLRADVPHVPSGAWNATGDMSQARAGATATLMRDGRVLVTGGLDASGAATASTERYSPDGGQFVQTASMSTPRTAHTSTLLPDGRVLVAGGVGANNIALSSVEIYDPTSNAWTAGTSLNTARSGHTATQLSDGRIAIVGGEDNGVAIGSIELYDPQLGTFTLSAAAVGARTNHAAALLNDGKLLIIGGNSGATLLSSTVIYDPATDTLAAGGALATTRAAHSATTLLSGKVLVAGGAGASGDLASAELYDPATNTFVGAGSMLGARQRHLAILLPHNNQVLIVGGTTAGDAATTAELYIPWQAGGTFIAANAPATTTRAWATAAALSFSASETVRTGPNDGLLLLAGGAQPNASEPTKSGELYGFATVTTDKADYAPGTKVTIRGSGWQAGETVDLTLLEEPFLDTHTIASVVADGAGNIFSDEFIPDAEDARIKFYLTAAGQTSRLQAQTIFTDAPNANDGVDYNLEGQNKGSSTWVTNNLAGWQELEQIPVRVALLAQNGNDPGPTVSINFDHSKNSGAIPGIQSLTLFGTTNYSFSSPPTLTVTTGDVWTLTFSGSRLNTTTDGFVEFRAVMAAGAHLNTGSSLAMNGSPSLGNLQIAKPAPKTGSPDLKVVKSGPSTAAPGATITYTLNWENKSTAISAATGVQLTDTVPTGLTFVSGTCVPGCTVNGSQLIWDLGTVLVGGAGSVSFQAEVDSGLAGGTVLTNTGTILSAEDDALQSDNSSSFATTVTLNSSTLAVSAASGTYGGTTNLSATLTSGSTPLSGKTVSFTLNGTSVGSAVTDASGIASLANVSLTGINAGTYSTGVGASFAGASPYSSSNGTAGLTVNQAEPTVTAVGGSFPFDNTAHAGSGSATGIGGVDLGAVTLTYSGTGSTVYGPDSNTAPTNVGTYTVTAHFAGNINYIAKDSTPVALTIGKIDPTVTAVGGSFPFDNTAHAGSGSATGIGGVDLGAVTLTYSGTGSTVYGPDSNTAPTNVGTYTVTAHFAGNANYNAKDSTAVALTITTVDPTVTAVGGTFPFDNTPHAGSGSATGVGGVALTPAVTLTYSGTGSTTYGPDSSTPPTNVGTYTVTAHFAGNTNYNAKDSTAVALTITAVDPVVTAVGGSFPYDNTPHAGSGSATGVGGVSLTPVTLTYSGTGSTSYGPNSSTAPTNVGTYTVTAHFAGNTNYNAKDSTAVALTITAVDPIVTAVLASYIYDGTAHAGSGSATGVGGVSLTPVTLTYSGTGSTSYGPDSSTAPTNVGTYTVTAHFAGNTNFNAKNSSAVAYTISKRPTLGSVVVTPSTQSYGANVTFTATLAAVGMSASGAATSVTFYIGTQQMTSAIPLTLAADGSLTATSSSIALIETVAGQLAPGVRQVTAVFGGVSPNFDVSSATTNLTINPRLSLPSDAGVYYTGSQVYWTTGPSTSTATVFLTATVKDSCPAGYCSGQDIRKAKVTFYINGTAVATNLPVGLVNTDDLTVGSAGTTLQYNLGTKSYDPLEVKVVIGGYYADTNPAHAVVTIVVAKPTGGNLVRGVPAVVTNTTNAAGTLKPVVNGTLAGGELITGELGKTKFLFDLTYTSNKKDPTNPSNPQGNVVVKLVSDRNASGVVDGKLHTYMLKSNAISTLQIVKNQGFSDGTVACAGKSLDPDAYPITVDKAQCYDISVFTSKANIQELLADGTSVSIDGGALMQLTVTDGDTSNVGTVSAATGDYIAVQVNSSKTGGVWFSTMWNGIKTIEVGLASGDNVVQ
jgi:uncharacterized repeat protein (TIGR01451 family)